MTAAIGSVLSARIATLAELQTVYGSRDLYDMLEVVQVDNHNQGVMNGNDN